MDILDVETLLDLAGWFRCMPSYDNEYRAAYTRVATMLEEAVAREQFGSYVIKEHPYMPKVSVMLPAPMPMVALDSKPRPPGAGGFCNDCAATFTGFHTCPGMTARFMGMVNGSLTVGYSDSAKCECGAASVGIIAKGAGHSSWCPAGAK